MGPESSGYQPGPEGSGTDIVSSADNSEFIEEGNEQIELAESQPNVPSPIESQDNLLVAETIDVDALKEADRTAVAEGTAKARSIIFGESLEGSSVDRLDQRRKQILVFTVLNANRMEDGKSDLLDLSQEIQELKQINEYASRANIKLKPVSELMDDLIREMGMDKVNPPASGVKSIYPAFTGGMDGWREQQSRLRKYQETIKGLESQGKI